MKKEKLLVPLFETFIRESLNGKRRRDNGQRIKPQTISNYRYVLKLLQDFEQYSQTPLLVAIHTRNNKETMYRELRKWRTFYREFSDFLFVRKHCFDNYAGHVFKIIKCFFRYLQSAKFLEMVQFYETFYVRRENIRIICLLPDRYCFLIRDEAFQNTLSLSLRRSKDMFVFGAAVALRFSDLINLRVRDIEIKGNHYYLYYRSVKTDTPVTVQLPSFVISIFQQYAKYKSPANRLFPAISLNQFNKNIRLVARMAGWTELIGKYRNRDGEPVELTRHKKSLFRFCDVITSHVMRRTGITLLLMMGMPEYLVRKISGHSAHSESFFRYVNLAQSYITGEMEKAYSKLLEQPQMA